MIVPAVDMFGTPVRYVPYEVKLKRKRFHLGAYSGHPLLLVVTFASKLHEER